MIKRLLLISLLLGFSGCATFQEHEHDLDCKRDDSRLVKTEKSLAVIPLAPAFIIGGMIAMGYTIDTEILEPPMSPVGAIPIGLVTGVSLGTSVGTFYYIGSILLGGLPVDGCF